MNEGRDNGCKYCINLPQSAKGKGVMETGSEERGGTPLGRALSRSDRVKSCLMALLALRLIRTSASAGPNQETGWETAAPSAFGCLMNIDPRPDGRGYLMPALRAWNHVLSKSCKSCLRDFTDEVEDRIPSLALGVLTRGAVHHGWAAVPI